MSDGTLEIAQPHRWSVARVLLLAATGICLYLLAPSIVEVFSAWQRLDRFDPIWLVVILACETASFGCIWALQRIVMPDVGWVDGALSQLVGNAFNRITPGGGATGTALQVRLLADAGHDLTGVASALTAESLMITLAILVLPVFSIPAILAGLNVPGSLADAAWIGVLVFVVVTLVGVWMLRSERPLCRLGSGLQWITNKLRRRKPPIEDLGARLLLQRDQLRVAVGSRWLAAVSAAVGRWVFEYLALLVALHAIGASPDPTLVLLAFSTAELLGLLPFTPGGLGFVEAGLTGTLALAGVFPSDAVLATLMFRLVSFWLPLPVGLVAAVFYRRRHPRRDLEADAARERSAGHTRADEH
ncbi:MAG TPA: lysylphosphatidylglycerol synthase transmembrane domain-containing protein [Acidimicrobiia bacterium]|nr:lysylphosphatidylglycerol synthase transmembrane domain-containing protein [Acidimicrobiia bacterium]